MNKNWRIGIDLGGTKIEGLAIDAHGRENLRLRVSTPAGDYHGTLSAIRSLVEDMEARLGEGASVGVGIPGALSQATGLVKNANSTCLIGRPLDRDLADVLKRPIRLANDADCFALSEATDGSAKGAPVVFGVILGTGVGGGIVINGRLLSGPNTIAGEWGHNPLPWPTDGERPGPTCYCGRAGCIETFLSGPAFSRDDGRGLSARDILAAGDAQTEVSLARYEQRLARALAHVINIIDPHVIVLGGGMSNIARLYETVPRLWGQWVFSDTVHTSLRPPKHGDSSGVRGAAWLWPAPGGEPESGFAVTTEPSVAQDCDPIPETIWLTRDPPDPDTPPLPERPLPPLRGEGEAESPRPETDSLSQMEINLLLTQRELMVAKTEAALADAAKSRFLAAASHDLRQPFQAMNLYLQVLEMSNLEPRARTALSLLHNSMMAGEELLKALLDISAFEAGMVSSHVTVFPVTEILHELADEYRNLADERGLSFRTHAIGALVETDRVLAKRMCRNLVHNAFRYTQKGGILIGCRRRGNRLLIQVYDTGPGIPTDKLQMIFEDFYQLDNPSRDKTKGLGLGLSIVQRTAHLLGQNVWVASRLGRGSVFSITLPLAPQQEDPPPSG
ncbi:ROK family protein [Telmatospirillum siberiense]|uniref:ROK family protein n=1 Tax=Telmatospirillum siberiense TaxID=382514 RepID=UPI0026800A83